MKVRLNTPIPKMNLILHFRYSIISFGGGNKLVVNMWNLLLLASLAYGYPAVTFENERNLITMPDRFTLNQLNRFILNHEFNRGRGGSEDQQILEQNPSVNFNGYINSDEILGDKDGDGDAGAGSEVNSGEVINADNLDNVHLLHGGRAQISTTKATTTTPTTTTPLTTTSTTTIPTTTSTTSTTTSTSTTSSSTSPSITSESSLAKDIALDAISKMKFGSYLKQFVHPHLEENLEKLGEDDGVKKEKVEGMGHKLKMGSGTPGTGTDEPRSRPRRLGINIPVIRLKVDDRVPLTGKIEVKINADELKPFCWVLVTFIVLLFIACVLGCVFAVAYLRRMQSMQYQDFQNQIDSKERTRGNIPSGSSIILRERQRERERHVSHPCRCGCEDDVTKSHIAEIIRGDPDRDSGTSSHMGCSSIV